MHIAIESIASNIIQLITISIPNIIIGVVHAWVGQKLLNCYILSVAVIASYFHVSA
jgi:hypothetical protein